ncbi:MAG: hypothetical protein PHU61_02800 [Candidatus Absconditabacteria bacterium]|nr:hypothetical protein [Candidatus Absconditabacteria bacterium]MDD3868663.1 hypothetical protein [Candidatus Absconditabacteria bacterium]MDD4714486.1 hypothetical protein [Candidatus Absconditabacteria bacterium]
MKKYIDPTTLKFNHHALEYGKRNQKAHNISQRDIKKVNDGTLKFAPYTKEYYDQNIANTFTMKPWDQGNILHTTSRNVLKVFNQRQEIVPVSAGVSETKIPFVPQRGEIPTQEEFVGMLKKAA